MTPWGLFLLLVGLVSFVPAAVRPGGQALAGSPGWVQRLDGMALFWPGVLALLGAGWRRGGG